MKLSKTRDESGKYTTKPPEEASTYKTIRIPNKHLEELRSLLGPDETLSDKVREAIVYFLKNFPTS